MTALTVFHVILVPYDSKNSTKQKIYNNENPIKMYLIIPSIFLREIYRTTCNMHKRKAISIKSLFPEKSRAVPLKWNWYVIWVPSEKSKIKIWVNLYKIKKLRVLSWQVLASLTNIRQVKEGDNYTLLFLTPNLKWQKFLTQGWGLVFTCRDHFDDVYNLTNYWRLLKLKLNVPWWITMCNQKVEIAYKHIHFYSYFFIKNLHFRSLLMMTKK